MRSDRRTLLIDGYQPASSTPRRGWFGRDGKDAGPARGEDGLTPPKAVSAMVIPPRRGGEPAAPKK